VRVGRRLRAGGRGFAPAAGIKDRVGHTAWASRRMAAHPFQYRTRRSPHGFRQKEIPFAWTPRQVGLQGRVCGGSTGRAVRKDDAAAQTPPLATGANVDCGLLADGQRSYKTFGGKPRPVTAFGREWPWASSSLAAHTSARRGLTARVSLRWKVALGTQWGQMDVRGNRAPSQVVGACLPADGRPQPAPLPLNCPGLRAAPSSGGPRRTGNALGEQIVTWLILPVVICLSQRLSHACLSISNYTVKLRMAH
jgi:hypothetical protein